MTIEELLSDYTVLAGCRDYLAAWDHGRHYAIFFQYAPDHWEIVRLYCTDHPAETPLHAKNLAAVCIMRYLSDVDGSYTDGAELLIKI